MRRAPSSTGSLGRKFVTAGWIVILVTTRVRLVEIGVLVLPLKLDWAIVNSFLDVDGRTALRYVYSRRGSTF
jgi:hypothetical protein